MNIGKVSYELRGVKLHGIHRYDGYRSEPVWKIGKNISGYHNYMANKQCSVPGRTLEQLRDDYGISV